MWARQGLTLRAPPGIFSQAKRNVNHHTELHRYDFPPERSLGGSSPDPTRGQSALQMAGSGARAIRLLPPVDLADQARVAGADGARRLALLAADILAMTAGVVVAARLSPIRLTAGGLLVGLVVTVAFIRLTGLHDKDTLVLRRSTLDEAPRLLELAALVACGYWLTLPQGPGRAPLLVLGAALFAAFVLFRAGVRSAIRSVTPPERCLFIGDMSVAEDVRSKVQEGRANATVIGALPLHESATADDFGGVDGLRLLVGQADVSRVILAPVSVSGADTLELVRVAKEAHVRVSIFPRLFEVIGTAVEYENLEGLTLMGVRRFGLSPAGRRLKRAFDLFGSGLALLACGPFMAMIALAVKCGSRGPVFFAQTRVGRDGQRFRILKFRSMVTDAEALKEGLREHNVTLGLFKIVADPRVTRVGRLLRRTSLDELPQLINVLRGEMSLVGPRPLVIDEDELVIGLDRQRLYLTPGITGPWQIMRSGRVPMREMVSIDYLYVSNWSLWTDVKVLLRTVSYVVGRRGL